MSVVPSIAESTLGLVAEIMQDLSTIDPSKVVSPPGQALPGETIVGMLKSDDAKRLWGLADSIEAEMVKLGKEEKRIVDPLNEKIVRGLDPTPAEMEKLELVRDRYFLLKSKLDAVKELFFTEVRRKFPRQLSRVGIVVVRESWKVVTVPEEAIVRQMLSEGISRFM